MVIHHRLILKKAKELRRLSKVKGLAVNNFPLIPPPLVNISQFQNNEKKRKLNDTKFSPQV